MNSPIQLHKFPDTQSWQQAVVTAIVSALRSDDRQQSHSVLFSGGQSPRVWLPDLAKEKLPWHRIAISLVDDRCVPADHPDSNARLMRECLLIHEAQASPFYPIIDESLALPIQDNAQAALHDARWMELMQKIVQAGNRRIDALTKPFSLMVLGMGDDGHIASLFPNAPGLAEALTTSDWVSPIYPSHAPYPRLSLSAYALQHAARFILPIQGERKYQVLKNAFSEGLIEDFPVRLILHQSITPVDIFWVP
jgi:6-phosphogluconolactonase